MNVLLIPTMEIYITVRTLGKFDSPYCSFVSFSFFSCTGKKLQNTSSGYGKKNYEIWHSVRGKNRECQKSGGKNANFAIWSSEKIVKFVHQTCEKTPCKFNQHVAGKKFWNFVNLSQKKPPKFTTWLQEKILKFISRL